ncbi:LysR family transcriptional regulator [Pseudomonas syringae]|uniref:Transcriptional regulator n=3 Tax=Pseudomonas syringae group TaxID=136849 RepID=A0A0Q0E495_PSESX|nr:MULTISPECIES: LysR family transcriptional regulator [Pseudomonas]KPZ08438.1 Transcriptional regulator [Pseudomonas syringae pv. spinaceae]KTB78464.1 LysR family transcriptional regulator [Pseudomonas syringae pv. syringae PD2774]KWS15129.1 LysR family transcriptional regulator [Pseudomonas syringae pv. syringae]KWS27349.1 LysR family transcriptional regulator [Pseudomonas syringae pv. syringae]MCA5966317.1 LysR family transcriptional regulator [Pseudomonas sp. P129]
MDLNAVQMLVSVVQAGSMTAGSDRLGVPLPTASRRIRALERALNVQLLERSARGVKLTEAGTRLFEHATRGLELIQEGEDAVMSDQAHVQGKLRLSVPPSFSPWWQLVTDFQNEHPDIRVHLLSTERRVHPVEDGIDVALRVGEVEHEALIARHLLDYRHVLVASPRFIATHGRPMTPEDLSRFPCATWSLGTNTNRTWRFAGTSVAPNTVLSTNDSMHLLHSVLAGEVITELPPFIVKDAIGRGLLVPLLSECPLPSAPLNLLYPAHRHPSAVVRTYLEYCRRKIPWLVEACTADAT